MKRDLVKQLLRAAVFISGFVLAACESPARTFSESTTTCAGVACPPAGVCEINACDPATGQCTATPAPEGAPCPDHGACQEGACVGAKVTVSVFDMEGAPIVGATVTHAASSHATGEDGAVALDAKQERFVAQVSAPGYIPAVAVVNVPPGVTTSAELRLMNFGEQRPFDADLDAAIITDDVKITIPAGSVVDENNDPIAGVVGITVAHIDPTGEQIIALPAPLEGVTTDGKVVDLASGGMAEITLWSGDQKLNLAQGATAEIEIVLPEALQQSFYPDAKVPGWRLDLADGWWKQEAMCTVGWSSFAPGKLACTMPVTHFSMYNIDVPVLQDVIEGKATSDRLRCVDVLVVDADNSNADNSNTGLEGATIRAISVNATPWNGGDASPIVGAFLDQATQGKATGTVPTACVHVMKPGKNADDKLEPAVLSRIVVTQPGYRMAGFDVTTLSQGFAIVDPNADVPEIKTTKDGEGDACKATTKSCLQLKVKMKRPTCLRGTVLDNNVSVSNATVQATYHDGFGPLTTTTKSSGAYCLTVPRDTKNVQVSTSYEQPVGSGVHLTAVKTVPLVTSTEPACEEGPAMVQCTQVPNLDPEPGGGTPFVTGKVSGPGEQYVTGAVATLTGGGVITGYFSGSIVFGNTALSTSGPAEFDAFVAKTSPDGAVAWAKKLGGPGFQKSTDVAIDAAGDVVVVGSYQQSLDLGNGIVHSAVSGYDGFVVKLSSVDASILWSKSFGGAGDQGPEGVAIDPSPGNPLHDKAVIVVGGYNGVLGNMCGSCVDDPDPAYCSKPCAQAQGDDVFVLKFYASGDILLGKVFTALGQQRAMAIAVDTNHNIQMTGHYDQSLTFGGTALQTSGVEPFFVKLDAEGNHLQSFGFGGDSSEQRGVAIATSAAGTVIGIQMKAGAVSFNNEMHPSSGSSFGNDMFVARLDAAGTPKWGRYYGFPGYQKIDDVALDAVGDAYLSGTVDDKPILFDNKQLPSAGGLENTFAVKLDKNGAAVWGKRFGVAGGSGKGYAYDARLALIPGALFMAMNFGTSISDNGTGALNVNPSLPANVDTKPDIAILGLLP